MILRLEPFEKILTINQHLKQFLLHQLNKVDESHHADGISLVICYSNATLSRANIKLVWFLLKKIKKYFPSVKHIIHYNSSAFYTSLAILANRSNKSQTENQFCEKVKPKILNLNTFKMNHFIFYNKQVFNLLIIKWNINLSDFPSKISL